MTKIYSDKQIFFKIKNHKLNYQTIFRKLESQVDPLYAAKRAYDHWAAWHISSLIWMLSNKEK